MATSQVASEGSVRQGTAELIQVYRETGSVAVRNRIVELNIGLVRREVHYWKHQCTENFEDLLQVGCIGLIKAVERYSLDKGTAFSSFAVPYIRGAIQHYLRDLCATIRLPRRWTDLQRQAIGVTAGLREDLQRQPNEVEVAAALGVSPEEWQQARLAWQNQTPVSLDLPMGAEDGRWTSLGDQLPDQRYRSFQLAEEDRLRLEGALVQLEARTREILEFVFLHEFTQKEVAESLQVSVVTVSRHIKKGLIALHKLLQETPQPAHAPQSGLLRHTSLRAAQPRLPAGCPGGAGVGSGYPARSAAGPGCPEDAVTGQGPCP